MEDVIPILLSQCPISNTLMDNQYLFRILDKDYSQYYSNSDEEIKFNQKVINSTNEKLLKKIKDNNYLTKKNIEIEHILKCNKDLPFPLLQHYLKMIVKLDVNDLSNFNLYKNCFCDLDNIQQNFFIEKIRRMNNIEPREEETEELIKTIINDTDFINLIDQIMKSKVINNAYYLINQLSLTNGNINLNEKMEIKLNNIEEEEEKEENYKNINLNKIEGLIISNSEKTGNIAEEKNSKINAHKNDDNIVKKYEPKNNLINEKSITYYYNKFLKTFDKTN